MPVPTPARRSREGATALFAGLLLVGCFPSVAPQDSAATLLEGVLIVKAAGPPPDQQPDDHPDAITAATSEPHNTHSFVEGLASRIQERGTGVTVLDHHDCPELDCAAGAQLEALVLAGPTWLSLLPSQLRELAEPAGELQPPPARASALASCENTGQDAVDAMLEDLSEAGLATVEGLALAGGGEVSQQEVDAALEAFADRLAP
jgi:flavorubredoxin